MAAEAGRQLTGRELEVVKLVAKGLSNADLAERLHLIDAIVLIHITRVPARPGLRGRVQVAYSSAKPA